MEDANVSGESFDEMNASQVGSTASEESEREIFRTDEETCTFGIVTAKGEYKPKSNFTMRLESFVDAGASTGYFVWVKRKNDGQEKLCYYTVESLMFKQRFLSELRSTFKTGGFTCAFTERELTEFHNFLEKNFSFDAEGKMKKGVICVGKQPAADGVMWILNQNVHVNEHGVLVDVQQSNFAWQPIGGPQIELVTAGKKSSVTVELCSEITLPLESKESLNGLLKMMSTLLKHNFVAGVLSVASGIMALHYQDILSMNSSCLIPFLFGESETGKSTAVKCALSISGQQEVSHLMKTKATSDSICMERIKKSTLPFSLDDPKNLDDIGELLIQLCNGHLSGNLRVGLHKPRCIPLICCNFPPSNVKRYSSRALLIPFVNPSVGPQNEAESSAFDKLDTTLRQTSAAVGWAISLGVTMKEEIAYIKGDLFQRVKERLPGVDSRLITGYVMCLFFAEKLVIEADFSYLKEELEEFLEEHVKKLLTPDSHQTGPNSSLKLSLVWNTINEVIEWAREAKKQGLFKVLQSVRTGISYQGRKVFAICWDDVIDSISTSPTIIREAIKSSNVGVNHVARDFVPKNSTNCNVKRGVNSHSRKCSVLWIDTMPKDLACKAERVTTFNVETSTTAKNTDLKDFRVADDLKASQEPENDEQGILEGPTAFNKHSPEIIDLVGHEGNATAHVKNNVELQDSDERKTANPVVKVPQHSDEGKMAIPVVEVPQHSDEGKTANPVVGVPQHSDDSGGKAANPIVEVQHGNEGKAIADSNAQMHHDDQVTNNSRKREHPECKGGTSRSTRSKGGLKNWKKNLDPNEPLD